MTGILRHCWRLWQRDFALAGVFLALAAILPIPAQAATTEEYTVIAMGVDHDSTTAAALALDYARKRAIFLALRQMGVDEPVEAAKKIKPEALDQIIRGATVQKSRRDGEQTYQEVNVTINIAALKQAIKFHENAAPAEAALHRNVLVLPVLAADKTFLVWKKDNLLRAPLASELLRQGHGLIMLPAGDMKDLRLIDGENVATVKPDELKPMFERYGADEIILALLNVGEGSAPSQVILRRLTLEHPHDEVLSVPAASAQDTQETRLNAAAQAIASAVMEIASSTSESDAALRAKATQIKAQFIYTIPREYALMTKTVRDAPGVMLLEQPAIAVNKVTGTIYLNGDKTELKKALIDRGVKVVEQGDLWILSTR